MTRRRRSHTVLDDGGLFTFRERSGPEDPPGKTRPCGFLLHADIAEDPEDRRVKIWSLDLTRAREALTPESEALCGAESDAWFSRFVVLAQLDLDAWTVAYPSATDGYPRDCDLESRFEALLEQARPTLQLLLERRWRFCHGVKNDVWRSLDWSWWMPGMVVPWHEIHVDDPHFLFPCEGDRLWAEDGYCVVRECGCREVIVVFRHANGDREVPVATIRVDLDRWTALPTSGGGPLSSRGQEIWSAWNDAYPDLREELRRRRPVMLSHGREVARLAGHAELQSIEPMWKIPRTGPCPCGSGLEYKECCLKK